MAAIIFRGISRLRNEDDYDEKITSMEKEIEAIKIRITNIEKIMSALISAKEQGNNYNVFLTGTFFEDVEDLLLQTDSKFQTEGAVPIRLFRTALIKANKIPYRKSQNQETIFNSILNKLEEEGFKIKNDLIWIPKERRG